MEARLEWLQEGLVKQQSDMESALHRDSSNARWELDQQVAELAATETLAEHWLSKQSCSCDVCSHNRRTTNRLCQQLEARGSCAWRCAEKRSCVLKAEPGLQANSLGHDLSLMMRHAMGTLRGCAAWMQQGL